MKAVVYKRYGSPKELGVAELGYPSINEDQLLIAVRGAAINPFDWHLLRGTPYLVRIQSGLFKPKEGRFGSDFAGVVEAVGKSVSNFKVGDEVFGCGKGAVSQMALFTERQLALKPRNLDFVEAAAVPMAGLTALQALRDKAKVQAGQKALIVGASGGVGTFAVQIAKAFGAYVTGVCSAKNVQLVKDLGAERVIDYTSEDFSKGNEKFDVIIQTAGTHSVRALRRVLSPTGTLVIVGISQEPKGNLGLGYISRLLTSAVMSKMTKQTFAPLLTRISQTDLVALSELIESGSVKPVLDCIYPMGKVSTAVSELERGHTRGKIVISI